MSGMFDLWHMAFVVTPCQNIVVSAPSNQAIVTENVSSCNRGQSIAKVQHLSGPQPNEDQMACWLHNSSSPDNVPHHSSYNIFPQTAGSVVVTASKIIQNWTLQWYLDMTQPQYPIGFNKLVERMGLCSCGLQRMCIPWLDIWSNV